MKPSVTGALRKTVHNGGKCNIRTESSKISSTFNYYNLCPDKVSARSHTLIEERWSKFEKI